MFLEGHRQNTANFGDVRQSSLLVRFGQLTPAFVLQVVAPLLLIFLGYGCVARETERGALRLLLLQGVRPGEVVLGKAMALGVVALIVAAPALAAFGLVAGQPGVSLSAMAVMALGFLIYLAVWVLAVVLVSARVGRTRNALLSLVAVWTIVVVLLPRVAPDIAGAAVPL